MAEHELKFIFPLQRAPYLYKWLLSRCEVDGEYPQARVSSIYYDTLDWNLLQEKINSDFLKTKYRLRWYEGSDNNSFSEVAFWEQKNKIGSARKKKRVMLQMNDAIRYASQLHHRFFIDLVQKHSVEIQPQRRIIPVFQVSYNRIRLVDKITGIRLAIDTDIHVPRINPMMVAQRRKGYLPVGVFECKSRQQAMPEWLHGVTCLGGRKAAFSKYSECYRFMNDEIE